MPFLIALGCVVLLAVAVFLFFPVLGGGNRFRPGLGGVQENLETRPVTDEKGCKVFGRAHLEKRGGLYLLFLQGTPYEMGYQHGVLLREEIRQGALLYHARPVQNQSPFNRMPAWQRRLLERFFDWTLFRPMLAHAPLNFLQELKGLSDGCGLPFDQVFRGNMLSEFNMNTLSYVRRALIRQIEGGCTSFAAYGSMCRDGRMVVGRNTDYSGGGLWDRFQVVFFYQPDEGFRFVNVGSAGLLKCNSCMNERGLVLGAHFMYSDDVSPEGVGFTALELEIMKKAATVEQAFEIVRQSPRNGAFGYLIASGEQGKAGVIEASAQHAGLRWAEDEKIWETNFMTTPETQAVDLLMRYGMHKNPFSRYERMRVLLEEHAGKVHPQAAAEWMGDHWNPGAQCQRPIGHIIGTLSNLTSVVFAPQDFNFWVADGLAPVCNNTFIGFHLFAELQGEPAQVSPSHLEPNAYSQSQQFSILRRYAEIKIKMTIPPTDFAAALRMLEDLIAQTPEEAAYRLVAARMHLRKGQGAGALAHLEGLSSCALSNNEKAQCLLLQGFASDLCGKRQEALQFYQRVLDASSGHHQDVLQSINPLVLANARRGLRIPFTTADARKLDLSMDLGSQHDI